MSKRSRPRCAGTKDKILKRCSTASFSTNVRNCMCRTGKKREQCVAIAYSVLGRACGVRPGKRRTPKSIVKMGKKNKRARARGRR